MEARDLIDQLAGEAQNLPEVIAPVLASRTSVGVIINNHPYRLYLRDDRLVPGWYVLKPVSSTRAVVSREAEPFEVLQHLERMPKLRVIAVRRLETTSWLVFPYNLSDARSRGFKGAPESCHLVDRNLEPFTAMDARLWGDVLIFDSSNLGPAPSEYLRALEAGEDVPLVPGLSPEYRIVYGILTDEVRKAREETVEGRIRSAVEYLGGVLIGYSELGEGYTVEWQDGHQTYRTRVDANLRLLSAGICLDGLEYEQTLSSTVAVMRRSYYEEDYDD